jgi:WD repeat-containing protein 68
MDWCKTNPAILGVCSIDTTCAIWDLTKNEVKTLLIAHDKEVYDISFGADDNTFITTGADGSVRLFDIRALDNCSVLFESQDLSPFTRVSWNFNNSNFVAALGLDKNIIYIIDQRMTNSPYALLNYHSNVVNALSWAPHSNAYICSVGDDKNSLIWDIQLVSNRTEDPLMSFVADYEIDNVSWSESHDEWIGITGGQNLQLLKIK